MPPSLRSSPSRSAAAWALASVLAVPTIARAAPVEPAGADFKIWYYKTNENGERETFFSAQDLAGYINRARCECAQDISTRILLSPAMGGTYNPNTRVQTYVGSRCDQAVGTFNPQLRPCVRVHSGFPNEYTKAINFGFAPIWLADGIVVPGDVDIGDAVPNGTCTKGQGDAGVWICIESNGITDCQAEEFQVQGAQNQNATGTMGATAMGIHFDFEAPINLPSNFTHDTGDGTVVIRWELFTTGDVAGYRVLCADEDGNPLPGKGLDPPPLAQINVGKLYFTQDNLCPGGPFGEDVEVEDETGGSESGGTDGTGTDGTGTDGTGGTGTDGTGTGTGTDGTGTGTGTTTTFTTTDASDSGSGSDTGSAPVDIPSDGIMSMKWEYVCSGHIGGTSREAKITGLENGRNYQFAVVAYDVAGNPVVASGPEPIIASPRETIDFWEQCEIDGDVCGEGGFCTCSLADEGRDDALWLGGLALVAALRRRRRGRS